MLKMIWESWHTNSLLVELWADPTILENNLVLCSKGHRKLHIPFDPEIYPLGLYPKEIFKMAKEIVSFLLHTSGQELGEEGDKDLYNRWQEKWSMYSVVECIKYQILFGIQSPSEPAFLVFMSSYTLLLCFEVKKGLFLYYQKNNLGGTELQGFWPKQIQLFLTFILSGPLDTSWWWWRLGWGPIIASSRTEWYKWRKSNLLNTFQVTGMPVSLLLIVLVLVSNWKVRI